MFIVCNVNSYSMNAILKAFTNNALPLNKINENPFIHDFKGTRRSSLISGNDMRNITDKSFEYRGFHDKSVQLKNLIKIKPVYLHPGGVSSNKYEKKEICIVNIKNGGLMNDFNDCFDDCKNAM